MISAIHRNRLAKWDHQYLWHPFTPMKEWEHEPPLIIIRGRGPYLYDALGRRYLDGTSSIWVNVHGHNHPAINAALRAQLGRVAHSTLLGLTSPPPIVLARELVRLAPPGLTRVFYSDDGSTAIEVALKMAVQYWRQRTDPKPKKRQFVHLASSYHGDTVGGMSVSDVSRFRSPFQSLLFRSRRADAPHCYRCPLKLTYPGCGLACTDSLEHLLATRHDRLAGVVVEPMVQAVAGMIPSPPGYLKKIRELCTRYGVLLIADEVATGFGRTGRMFACDHEGVTPDLLAVAKGLTGGYLPLAATLATDSIYQAFWGDAHEGKTFYHGHSYTGNPLGCAAALANLATFHRERTLQKVRKHAKALGALLEDLRENPLVGDVRQCGYMVGIELVKDPRRKTSFPARARVGYRVAREARHRGLLIRPIGDVLILLPPLNVTLGHLRQMTRILQASIQAIHKELAGG